MKKSEENIKYGPREKSADRNLNFKAGKWYLDYTVDGRRVRKFGGYTKDQARDVLAKARVDRLNEKLGFGKPKAFPDVPFKSFADEFLELYSKQNKRSWRRDVVSLNNLKRHFAGKALHEIGPEQVERFKAERKAESVSSCKGTKTRPINPSTINRELACLKTLFSKALEWGRIEKNTVRTVKKFKEDNVRERILKAEEARRLIEAASPALRTVLIVALGTGMRKSEILNLKWKNVDFLLKFILIEMSKSGKSRKVPMNGDVTSELMALPKTAEYVFYNPETKRPIKDIKVGFKAACRRATIAGLRLHDLRHTAATWMIQAGVDIVTVSKILGHASIQMTMRYAHPTPENMRRAVERLEEQLDMNRHKVDTVTIPRPVSHAIEYN